MKTSKLCMLMCLVFVFSSCARLSDVGKRVWGNSTRDMEDGRSEAISRAYACAYFECFDAVTAIAKEREWRVFSEYEVKGLIVLMGLENTVDTTEVGVFLSESEEKTILIEVSSRSSNAKRRAAKVLFDELDKRFVPRTVDVYEFYN